MNLWPQRPSQCDLAHPALYKSCVSGVTEPPQPVLLVMQPLTPERRLSIYPSHMVSPSTENNTVGRVSSVLTTERVSFVTLKTSLW